MALLARLRSYWQLGAAQESIDEAAQTQQIIERADEFKSL
jgi:CHASE3 domain sensor protein